MATVPGLKAWPYRCLAGDAVDSTGVPVAAVVAESAALARQAIELIEVDYEPLPAVSDPERAGARRAARPPGSARIRRSACR
jgi:carbon-monoxide dehydrogenase large subunit